MASTGMTAGDVVADRYVIRRRLGAGGMGAVFLAHDRKLDRPVALKTVRATESALAERMVREARAAARLRHPSIVEVYDVGVTEDGRPYLVMEQVEGRNLRGALEEGVEQAEALRILRAVAEALDAAHGAGLVHRDVKPENVMIRDDGRVVLLDFGLVKEVDSPLSSTVTPDGPTLEKLTLSGAIVGTPAYLAPEQARGHATPATDQWALAVMAFELLSGEIPWDAEDATRLLAQILLDDAPPLSSRVDGISASEIREGNDQRAGAFQAAVPLAEGARAYLSGDVDDAARRWRPLVSAFPMWLPPEVFDRAGDPHVARRLDASRLDDRTFGGIHPSLAREAERSLALGEPERARELAARVIEAWETADVELAVVARMRALLARLDAPPSP